MRNFSVLIEYVLISVHDATSYMGVAGEHAHQFHTNHLGELQLQWSPKHAIHSFSTSKSSADAPQVTTRACESKCQSEESQGMRFSKVIQWIIPDPGLQKPILYILGSCGCQEFVVFGLCPWTGIDLCLSSAGPWLGGHSEWWMVWYFLAPHCWWTIWAMTFCLAMQLDCSRSYILPSSISWLTDLRFPYTIFLRGSGAGSVICKWC